MNEQTEPNPETDGQDRQNLMQRDVLLLVTAGMSLLNGMHISPYYDPAFFLMRPFAASFGLTSPLILLYLASMFVSLLTLLLGGVPAALYERARGLTTSTPLSIGIWAISVGVLSLPTWLAFFAG